MWNIDFSNVKYAGAYARECASQLIRNENLAGLYDLGAAWGIYAALAVLIGDYKMDIALAEKVVEKFPDGNVRQFFVSMITPI